MNHLKYFILSCLILIFITSCSEEEESVRYIQVPNQNEVLDSNNNIQYLHLSHTRSSANPFMVSGIKEIDYSKFDMLWLGGDLAYQSSIDNSTMNHIDSIFNLGKTNTLWALGNHDYNDLNRVQLYTNRPSYYTAHKNGITFIVLDTQDSLSNVIGYQKALFDRVLDTLEHSSHLVILHHKLIWMYNNINLQGQISSVPNGSLGSCFYCINPNNFYPDLYPKLVAAKNKGIDVLCIAGDIGKFSKEFQYTTAEGIIFLASGVSYTSQENKALLFTHELSSQVLTWEYKTIENLK